MAIVWQNSFDGVPLTVVSEDLGGPGTTGDWGDPIVNLRNSASITHVRYGDLAYGGRASLMLGSDVAESGNHGDVQLTQPVGEWSVSFYMYRTGDGWVRFLQDGRVNVSDLYLDFASGAHFVGWTEMSTAATDQMPDRWVRCEASQGSAEVTWRFWWADPDSTGAPDYEITVPSSATSGYLFVQGGGASADHPPAYVDQVRIGEGEWLGPWPTHRTLTASAILPLAGSAQISAELDDGTLTASATLPLSASATLVRQGQFEAGATLPLSGSARIVRHARMDATAALGVAAPEVDITREGRFTAGTTLPLAGHAELRSQFRATFPPHITTELLLGGQWVDVSGDVYTRDAMQISRGRADEAATADPASCALTLNNRHGRYSPHNPMSPYYGQIGKNTPARVRVGPIPEQPDLELADTFDRTITGGWGTADTGQTWTGDSTGVSVSGGAGRHVVAALGADGDRSSTLTIDAQDVDVTVAVSLSDAPQGWIGGAAYAAISVRQQDPENRLTANIGFRVDTGYRGGIRISTHINATLDGAARTLAPIAMAQGLAYQTGQWLRARVQAVGPEVRVRVWLDGDPEPDHWHSQGYLPGGPSGDGLALRSSVNAEAYDTGLPVTVSYRGLQARPIHDTNLAEIMRFSGVVSEWPARWDVSDSDVWVPVTASGVLRRLGQGAKPLRSVLRRTLATDLPTAYWPLEDGARTREATSLADGTGPLRTAGFVYAEDDSLPTSEPLPTLSANASMSVQSLASEWAGTGWEVSFLYNLEAPRDAYVGSQPMLGIQTATDNILVDLIWDVTERPRLRTTVTSGSGTQLVRESIFIDQGIPAFYGAWRRLRVYALQSGGTVTIYIDRLDEDSAWWGNSVSYTGTLSRVTGVTTQFGDQLEGMALGHLTVWGAPGSTAYIEGFPGYERESARNRISRLSAGAGVPLEITGAASEALGVEQQGTYLETITAAQEADLGAPGEARYHLGLTYRGRDLLYHAEPALVLDYTAGEISPPMEPTDDDQNLRNDIEVKRDDGASFQVEDTAGPLGVDTVGRYDESVTLSLATDSQAANQAGWRLHLGTVDELRWPMIHLNLANPRLSARVEDILALDVGDRIRILNPPRWTQAAHLDLIVQGYTETLNAFVWGIELTCTPASPWQPAQIANGQAPPDAPMRADTAGSELAEGVGVDDTLMIVQTTRGPTWITTEDHPDSLPLDITVGGEVMRVTTIIGDGTALPQSMVVERAINAVHKPHPTGAPVRLAYPAVVAL